MSAQHQPPPVSSLSMVCATSRRQDRLLAPAALLLTVLPPQVSACPSLPCLPTLRVTTSARKPWQWGRTVMNLLVFPILHYNTSICIYLGAPWLLPWGCLLYQWYLCRCYCNHNYLNHHHNHHHHYHYHHSDWYAVFTASNLILSFIFAVACAASAAACITFATGEATPCCDNKLCNVMDPGKGFKCAA